MHFYHRALLRRLGETTLLTEWLLLPQVQLCSSQSCCSLKLEMKIKIKIKIRLIFVFLNDASMILDQADKLFMMDGLFVHFHKNNDISH